jgi:hypothetical protein
MDLREQFSPTKNRNWALSVGGRILGIVEAKKLTLGPQNVLSQAEKPPHPIPKVSLYTTTTRRRLASHHN